MGFNMSEMIACSESAPHLPAKASSFGADSDISKTLSIIVKILKESNEQIKKAHYSDTGFQAMNPLILEKTVLALSKLEKKPVLDLGCGNGGFALMMANAGFPSYGIDINPYLIKKAEENKEKVKNLLSAPCKFAVGNFYPRKYLKEYEEFALKNQINPIMMPFKKTPDPYEKLGIRLKDVRIIYAFTWKDQMPFLLKFLEKEAPQAIYVLPHYKEGRLRQIVNAQMFVGGIQNR